MNNKIKNIFTLIIGAIVIIVFLMIFLQIPTSKNEGKNCTTGYREQKVITQLDDDTQSVDTELIYGCTDSSGNFYPEY